MSAHNPADATTRNVRASKKRDDALDKRVDRLEKAIALIAHTLHYASAVKFDDKEFFEAIDGQ